MHSILVATTASVFTSSYHIDGYDHFRAYVIISYREAGEVVEEGRGAVEHRWNLRPLRFL